MKTKLILLCLMLCLFLIMSSMTSCLLTLGSILSDDDTTVVNSVNDGTTTYEKQTETVSNIPIGKQNALKKANSYLKHMAFSKKGLINQLEFEGYTTDEATYAVNNCGADWNEQAAKKAESYLKHLSFSRKGLIEQLEFDGFTHEQAEYGVRSVGYEEEKVINIKEMKIENFTFDLPNYWEEEGSKTDYRQFYAEKGDRVVMLGISYPLETDDSYDVSFDGLMNDNDNMIKAIEKRFTECHVVNYEIFESNYNVKGIIYQYTYTYEMTSTETLKGGGYQFCFPSEEDRRWFFVEIIYTNNLPINTYKDDFLQMLSSIRKK